MAGLTVEYLGSRNGTWVNGEQVEAPRALADGDQLRVGMATMTCREHTRRATSIMASRYSMTRHGMSPCVPTSKSWQTFGWARAEIALASRWNLAWRRGSRPLLDQDQTAPAARLRF